MIEIELKSYIEKITGLKASPVFGLAPYPALSYKITPISGGVVKQSQLEARILGDDYDELLTIKQQLIDTLDMTEQMPSVALDSVVIRSVLAGGGDLFNEQIQMWETPTFFIITWRCK